MNEDADNKNESPAPAKLAAAFKSLRRDPIFVPPSVDEAILREAREHFQKLRPMPSVWRRFAPWTALAASVVGLAWAGALFFKTPTRLALRNDVNGDGQVDILDAYALARTIEQGKAEKRWDLNGDGKVDELDVNWIASRVVQIVEGSAEKPAATSEQPAKPVFASRTGPTSRVGGRS